jgi:hypothetical protein
MSLPANDNDNSPAVLPLLAAPKSHAIVPVAAQASSYDDQTSSNVSLSPGAVFAYVRSVNGCLRICPTTNLPNEVKEVFLGHDGQPNLVNISCSCLFLALADTDSFIQIFNPFANVIEVGHEGIKEGDVLMCRCTQNTWVQHENHIVGMVGTDRICTAFDQKDIVSQGGYDRELEGEGVSEGEKGGVEHVEEGGGVLIGEGLGVWKELSEFMTMDMEDGKIEVEG